MVGAAGLLVLAGGRSERMGRDKAWLPVDGQPALLRVLAAGRDAGVRARVVVGSPGQSLPRLPPDVVRVDDPTDRRHEGPLSGLAVGLEPLAAQGVALACLAACDALWLGPAHVRFMLERLAEVPERDAVVPESEPLADGTRMLHPLCAVVRVAPALRAAQGLLAVGERAARALLLRLGVLGIAVAELPEPRVVEACNTPQQWAAAVAARRGLGDPRSA
jgi:molybdenum cofactor guanylyltransferase